MEEEEAAVVWGEVLDREHVAGGGAHVLVRPDVARRCARMGQRLAGRHRSVWVLAPVLAECHMPRTAGGAPTSARGPWCAYPSPPGPNVDYR